MKQLDPAKYVATLDASLIGKIKDAYQDGTKVQAIVLLRNERPNDALGLAELKRVVEHLAISGRW